MNLKELIFGGGVKNAGAAGTYRDSIQAWLLFKSIVHSMVVTKDNRFVKICEVLPVNFYLKSPMVRTQKANMDDYVARMRAYAEAEENEKCREMIEDNIAEVDWLGASTAITRRFFLVFQYEPQMKTRGNTVRAVAQRLSEEADTARRYLDICGLEVLEPRYADNTVLELLYELINKKTSRRVKLPEGVFDMTTAVHGIYENE